ncbi:hypothetical protein ANO14919_019010 [Xylariales sp. No.14919]|nr:hypothetical protein ANO14919_019010 [Xylariales sp. No.14919]
MALFKRLVGWVAVVGFICADNVAGTLRSLGWRYELQIPRSQQYACV